MGDSKTRLAPVRVKNPRMNGQCCVKAHGICKYHAAKTLLKFSKKIVLVGFY